MRHIKELCARTAHPRLGSVTPGHTPETIYSITLGVDKTFFSFAFCLFVLFLLCSSLEYLSRVSSPILQPERECEADEGREHKLMPQERLHHLSLNQHLQDLPAQAPPPALGSEGSHVLGSSLCRNPEKGLEKFLNPQSSPSPRRIISQKPL